MLGLQAVCGIPDTGRMTDTELVALAAELAQRVKLLAELLEHPRINAALIDLHRAEALASTEALSAGLLDMAGQGLFA